jgi:hypothetical protein
MAEAKVLIPFVLQWEGGFADHPKDKGGATNKGVTLSTFRRFFGKDATVDQLKAISDEQWEMIFRNGFWDKFEADKIANQSVANVCVDWAWCSGPTTAIRQVQGILDVKADGVVGNITLGAINNAEPEKLFDKIKSARLAFVESLVKRDASQKVFLKGWIRRIDAIEYRREKG